MAPTIASLLASDQKGNDPETQMVLRESMCRILSIAVTHELLSQVGPTGQHREVIINITITLFNTLKQQQQREHRIEVTEGDDFRQTRMFQHQWLL